MSKRCGVHVPGLRMVDAQEGVIGIEWIEGESVRLLLGAEDEETDDSEEPSDQTDHEEPDYDPLVKFNTTSCKLITLPPQIFVTHGFPAAHVMHLIGTEIAKMHAADVIHGDLTTSNMMLRRHSDEDTEVVRNGLFPFRSNQVRTNHKFRYLSTLGYPTFRLLRRIRLSTYMSSSEPSHQRTLTLNRCSRP